jgi:transposase
MLVAIPGTVVTIRRKPKQEKEFGRRLQFWHPRPFAKEVEMPARRLSMRKIREMLRLLWECELSQRQVAACCGLSKGAVAECAARAQRSGIDPQSAAALSDAELEARLYPPAGASRSSPRPAVDWPEVHRQLKGKNVTLQLLWEEYHEREPRGYRYSRFCELYQRWRKRTDVTMRQLHRAGEKLFVDYCGQTVPVVTAQTGEVREAQVFVAVWGASNFTFAEATWTQSLPDWIGSHVRAFEFSGGVPEMVVPDNTRTGVKSPCRYEPELNPTYRDLAVHYATAVLPARVRKPRDKAKVEVGVQVVQRWILARLRHRTFFCLAELNAAIRELLERLNDRPFRKLPGSRRSLFESLDRPALRPLPAERFVYAEWIKARVHIDYHVEVEHHYYSVPYRHVGQQLDVRVSAQTVECFLRGQRIASHARSRRPGQHTTVTAHMPRAHRDYVAWTPQRLVRWAQLSGPSVAALVEAILTRHVHAQQGFRSCLGILRLGQRYGGQRLEAACRRALAIGAASYRSVRSILQHRLDAQLELGLVEAEPLRPAVHENLRGAAYYGGEGEPSC